MPILQISGDLLTPSYQEAKLIAEDILSLDPSLRLECVGLIEVEWAPYLTHIKRVLGGKAHQHSSTSPLIVHSSLGYIGSIDSLIQWASLTYSSFIDPRSLPEYQQAADALQEMANKEFAEFIERSPHKYAYMDFHFKGLSKHCQGKEKQQQQPKQKRIIFELYKDKCPKTVDNFLALCSSSTTSSSSTTRMIPNTSPARSLSYLNSPIHRIVRNGWIQGGDIINGHGNNGYSIYGNTFADENLSLPHDAPGVLAMSNNGIHTHSNNSQFYITLRALPSFNGHSVVFGRVIVGMDVCRYMNEVTLTQLQRPVDDIVVENCDVYNTDMLHTNVSAWTKNHNNNNNNNNNNNKKPQKIAGKAVDEEKEESKKAVEPSKYMTMVVIGPYHSGKTTLVNSYMKKDTNEDVHDTIGFELNDFIREEYHIKVYGLGGATNIRGYWSSYYDAAHAIVFVVDASHTKDDDYWKDTLSLFQSCVSNAYIHGKPVLVLANKQDMKHALSMTEVSIRLQLDTVKSSPVHIEKCIAKYNANNINNKGGRGGGGGDESGMEMGLSWLLEEVNKQYKELCARVEKDVVEKKAAEKARMQALRERIEREKAEREALEGK